jgi:hypothetical protein
MATYATYKDFAPVYLPQVNVGDSDTQSSLNAILLRSQAIVDSYLGFSFNGFATDTVKKVRANGGAYFRLPAHDIGTVSAVTDGAGTVVDSDYWYEIEETGNLIALNSGIVGRWYAGWYDVTADWGYGIVSNDVLEVVFELAVHIWQARMAGNFSNVVGVQGGGAVGYERALTPRQKMVLDLTVDKYRAIPT